MIIILVGVDEDVGLEVPLKDEKFVVRVVRLQRMYEWLVSSVYDTFASLVLLYK